MVRKMGRIGRIFSYVFTMFVYYITTQSGQKGKMRIIEEVKLDFNDVLIKPKRSTLISRKDAWLARKFKFRHSNRNWEGVPIIASNMDHTGTLNMFMELTQFGMLTALCKFTRWPSNL